MSPLLPITAFLRVSCRPSATIRDRCLPWKPLALLNNTQLQREGIWQFPNQNVRLIGVPFGCLARKIEGDSWFTKSVGFFFLIYQGNPSISPKRTPMVRLIRGDRAVQVAPSKPPMASFLAPPAQPQPEPPSSSGPAVTQAEDGHGSSRGLGWLKGKNKETSLLFFWGVSDLKKQKIDFGFPAVVVGRRA